MKSLYIVIPAYNEEDNIDRVIRQWHPVVEKIGGDSRLLIVNDGSRDKTHEKVIAAKREYPRVICLNKKNQGHGATVLRGYRYALSHGADYIFQTDSDGQTLPEDFWQIWRDRRHCGLLIGYRKERQDGLDRVFVTRVLRIVLFVIFGVWTMDANTPFRLMRGEQLREVMEKIPRDFNLSNVIMTVIYEKFHLGVFYYPITFQPRQGGKNSINLKRITKIGWLALGDFVRLRIRYDRELRKNKLNRRK